MDNKNIDAARNWTSTVMKLCNVNRFSMATLASKESVLEHVGMVALISLQVGEGLNDEGNTISLEKLLIKSLLHDIEETIVGDLPRPTKHHSMELRILVRELESESAEAVLKEANLQKYFHHWNQSKDGPEGHIVSFVDILVVLMKFHDEIILRGNRSMIDMISPTTFETVRGSIKKVMTYFEGSEILEQYCTFSENLINQLTNLK